ncbi:MAG: lipopolysaccharide assembly protein LapA domain-containing protein [Thermodesulfobacteriota bacterium]
MPFFCWMVRLIVIGLAIFAIQNSDAPLVTIKFIFWQLGSSLVDIILASIGLGIFVTLLFWIPRAVRSSFEWEKAPKEVPKTSHNPFKKKAPTVATSHPFRELQESGRGWE